MTDKTKAMQTAMEGLECAQEETESGELWYAYGLAIDALREALSEPVGINGLTQAETDATMSVRGLSEPVDVGMEAVGYEQRHAIKEAHRNAQWEQMLAEQEPVGEIRNKEAYFYNGMYTDKTDLPDGAKLYTAPQPAQPKAEPVNQMLLDRSHEKLIDAAIAAAEGETK